MKYILVFIICCLIMTISYSQICMKMQGGCAENECVNNKCKVCAVAGKSTESECRCSDGEYYEDTES